MRNSFLNNMPPVTKNLIIINLIVWLAAYVLQIRGIFDVNEFFGLHYWAAEKFNLTQLLTYMFLHATVDPVTHSIVFGHVFFNMFAVFMFGMVLERFWGSKRFLFYYLFCGVGAGVVQEIVWTIDFHSLQSAFSHAISSSSVEPLLPFQTEFAKYFQITNFQSLTIEQILQLKSALFGLFNTVGASGAVFGILLAFGWLFPKEKIYFYFLIPIQARIFVILYGIAELFYGVASFRGDNVAHFAHLGGMLFGLILLLWWHKKGHNKNWSQTS
ncbi:MAG: rhomboid family intramembrane serine protease [Prevotellaceae bacterium]|jgi:membrane associated rhomboid family serine protease|nr:rhomboid family intramembrane serine protease [Prevotellaceae bacterium]